MHTAPCHQRVITLSFLSFLFWVFLKPSRTTIQTLPGFLSVSNQALAVRTICIRTGYIGRRLLRRRFFNMFHGNYVNNICFSKSILEHKQLQLQISKENSHRTSATGLLKSPKHKDNLKAALFLEYLFSTVRLVHLVNSRSMSFFRPPAFFSP